LSNIKEWMELISESGDPNCAHKNVYYQPEEWDINVPEALTCEDCGADLPLPEPDDNE
tara:strand:+ start:26420 stop:26593 length:174 start_codon:yes stop_codon:yes gene_type:complete